MSGAVRIIYLPDDIDLPAPDVHGTLDPHDPPFPGDIILSESRAEDDRIVQDWGDLSTDEWREIQIGIFLSCQGEPDFRVVDSINLS